MNIQVRDETEELEAYIQEHPEYGGIYNITFRPEDMTKIKGLYYCLICGNITEHYALCSLCEDPNGGDGPDD